MHCMYACMVMDMPVDELIQVLWAAYTLKNYHAHKKKGINIAHQIDLAAQRLNFKQSTRIYMNSKKST